MPISKPRIIAGSAKGRVLAVPKQVTRPSPARLREAVFNILAFYEKGHFLDIFGGSGAIALEAASRGWQATCVEIDRDAVNIIRGNARALSLNINVIQADALQFVNKHPQNFDVVFAAPPYNLDLITIFQRILVSDVARNTYILQYPSKLELALPQAKYCKHYKYGTNALSVLQHQNQCAKCTN